MANKVFVSYKYSDSYVKPMGGVGSITTARNYVDVFERKVKDQGIEVYKGESDGEDLSHLTHDTIWRKLKDRIYDSTVTIVFVSPHMKDMYRPDKDQWIPWEISYSLRKQSRDGRTSHRNSLIYVILPSREGYYDEKGITQFRIMEENRKNNYAEVVKWDRFILDIIGAVERANKRRDSVADYLVCCNI